MIVQLEYYTSSIGEIGVKRGLIINLIMVGTGSLKTG